MESRKMLSNAGYFAFTATPKNKTLEIFGAPVPDGDKTRHVPFHSYTMKQAIDEDFIIDVLANFTPVESYYRLVKTVEGDPEFDNKRARKKLRSYVEDHDHAIRKKAEIIVDHFHEQVVDLRMIGGAARAMVVTRSIRRAVRYYYAIRAYLKERNSPYRAVVAFSGEHEYDGDRVTEATLNGFSSNLIESRIQQDPYRFLVCADKFQTGYDEPLLHTMYVDKPLSGVKAVQTLSRLNRAHPKKHSAFVLDFANDADTIREPSPTTTAQPYSLRRPTRTSSTTSRPNWTVARSTAPTRWTTSSNSICRTAPATSSIPSWTPAFPSTESSWTRTARWTSRARRRRSSAPTASWRPFCPTPTPSGRSSPSFSTSSFPSCPPPSRTTCQRGFSRPSTWTATGWRSRR